MAAKIVLSDVTSGQASSTLINANNAKIEALFEKCLILDGTGTNVMTDTFDMNGFNILNLGNPITLTGFDWQGPWVTSTDYIIGDVVEDGGTAYIAITVHTSGTFATDLAANKWQLVASAGLPTQSGNSGKYLTTDNTTASWVDASLTYMKLAGSTMTADLVMSNCAIDYDSLDTIASATTTDLGSKASNNVDISGTTTITGLGTANAGTYRFGRFTGILTLTYNATSLILPSEATITTAVNDRYDAISLGSGNWFILDYVRADGKPLVNITSSTSQVGGVELITTAEYKTGTDSTRAVTTQAIRQGHIIQGTLTDVSTGSTSYNFATSIPSWVTRITIMFDQISTNSTSTHIIQIGDAGGIETSGYLGSTMTGSTGVGSIAITNGFGIKSGAAANIYQGTMILTLMDRDTFLWTYMMVGGFSNVAAITTGGGKKALSDTLTQMTFTTTGGSNTFDNGQINYFYE